MKSKKTKIEGYQTALVVVFIFSLLGYYLQNDLYFKLAGVTSLIAMVWIGPFVHFSVVWFGLGYYLGLVMSKFILSVVFYAVISPMGFLFRLFKRDTMFIKRTDSSMFLERNKKFEAKDVTQPY